MSYYRKGGKKTITEKEDNFEEDDDSIPSINLRNHPYS